MITKEELAEKKLGCNDYICMAGYITKNKKQLNKCENCQFKKLFLTAFELGQRSTCEICEQHMIESHPGSVGCAFRRLGNEYCWEFKKDEKV